jgi:hypothetical protein
MADTSDDTSGSEAMEDNTYNEQEEGRTYYEDDEDEYEDEPQGPNLVPTGLTVPLSSINASPAEIMQAQEQHKLQNSAFRQPVDYTPAVMNASTAYEISKQRAEKASTVWSGPAAQKAAQKIEKAIDETAFDPTHVDNVHVMNEYRKEYKNKIDFAFKNNYTVHMHQGKLAEERKSFEMILNAVDGPAIVKGIGKKVSHIVQEIFKTFEISSHVPYLNPATFEKRVEENMKAKYFDEEAKQLAIKYSYLLQQGPEARALGKFIWLFYQDCEENSLSYKASTTSRPLPNKMATAYGDL